MVGWKSLFIYREQAALGAPIRGGHEMDGLVDVVITKITIDASVSIASRSELQHPHLTIASCLGLTIAVRSTLIWVLIAAPKSSILSSHCLLP